MKFHPISRGYGVHALCGMILSLVLASGCGRKPAPPPPPSAKPQAQASKAAPATNDVSDTTSNQYSSVFEDLPPKAGKDPFYPTSHRRDPVESVQSSADAPPAEPVLVCKAIVHSSRYSQAVINNQALGEGEQGTVVLPGGRKIQVKCVQIGDDFVLVQIVGESETKRLTLAEHRRK